MRYPKEQKEATRLRVVNAAARRFREHGGRGAGIATVMKASGLTHGAFYKHFTSKEQLFEEALAASIDQMRSHLSTIADSAGPDASGAIVDAYLSEGHCINPGQGCPLAALGAEITRLPRASRDACRRMLMEYARRMARYMPGPTEDARERRAVVVFSAMAGTLAFARSVTDPQERARLLFDARIFYRSF